MTLENSETKGYIIAVVLNIKKTPSDLEGINQEQYVIEFMDDKEDIIEFSIPLHPKEKYDIIIKNSILSQYLDEIQKIFPEIENFVSHEDKIKFLIGKRLRWTNKRLGKNYEGFPALKYWVPRKLEEK